MASPVRIFKQSGPILLLGLAGLATIYFWFDPSRVSFFPPCPFRLLTGLECPGCGSQRCLHQLLHGHIEQAYQHNPLMVLALPYVFGGLLLEYTPLGKAHPAFQNRFYGKTASLLVFGVVVVYWIGRNIF